SRSAACRARGRAPRAAPARARSSAPGSGRAPLRAHRSPPRRRTRALPPARRPASRSRSGQHTRVSAYDRIARIYDPWSVSVVEDVDFYVAEAVRSGGPVLELGVGTGRIAVPIAPAGQRVLGVDSS